MKNQENRPLMPIIIENDNFDPSISLRKFFTRYLEDIAPRLKRSTVECKIRVINEYVMPYLGDHSLSEITPQHIRTWQNRLITQFDFSSAYLNLIDRHFSSIMNYAKLYYDFPSPFDKAGHIKLQKNHNMKIWSVEEFQTFITQFQNNPALKCLYEILYWNGLRIGEALALTPEDISKNPMEIRVYKSMSATNEGEIVSTPKTKKANRRVSMPDFVYDDLANYIQRKKIPMKARLFDFSRTYVRAHIIKACEETGIRRIRVHDLRHSHVSLLIQMGYSPVLIADRVGHEKVSTTLNTYAHLFPSQQAMIATSLEKVNALGVTPTVVCGII